MYVRVRGQCLRRTLKRKTARKNLVNNSAVMKGPPRHATMGMGVNKCRPHVPTCDRKWQSALLFACVHVLSHLAPSEKSLEVGISTSWTRENLALERPPHCPDKEKPFTTSLLPLIIITTLLIFL